VSGWFRIGKPEEIRPIALTRPAALRISRKTFFRPGDVAPP
jgi:hypothetical protein